MKKSHWLAYTVTAILATMEYSVPARSENMDYATLQSMFNEPVTTSAIGIPQRASDVATNMTIITADEIRQSGTRSIPQIIGIHVPGIDILQTGYASQDVGVRGYQQPAMPRLLVLVDGRQVFIDDFSRTVWNNIPVNIDDIRQIEVVEGPASALFGSNAAGGVVNIVTYSPLYDKNNVASAYAGSERTFGGDATVTRNGSWGGNKTTIGGYNAHEFNAPVNPAVDVANTQPYHRYATNSSVFQVTPKLQGNTEFTYAYSKENFAQPDSFAEDSQHTSTYSLRGGFQWQTDYGLIINDNYYNHSYADVFTSQNLTGRQGHTTGLALSSIEDQFKFGSDNSFRIGLEYRNKTYHDSPAIDFFPQTPALEENNYAANAAWLWQINDKLSWTNAARFDHMEMRETGTLPTGSYYSYADYSHNINTWSGNSGFNYNATDKDTFRLTYGRGVQQPSMLESAFGLDYFKGIVIEVTGNPKLKPTIVENYEFDYDRKIPDISSTVKFAVFYQKNKDIKDFVVSPGFTSLNGVPAILFAAQNIGDSKGWGGEVELKGAKDGFRWDASYSLSRVDDNANTEALLNYNGSAPEHHFRLVGGYTWGQWEFDGNGQYVTSTSMLHSNGITNSLVPESGYYSFGGRIGYNISDQFTLALSGTNITRQYTQENPYMAVERTAIVTLTGKF